MWQVENLLNDFFFVLLSFFYESHLVEEPNRTTMSLIANSLGIRNVKPTEIYIRFTYFKFDLKLFQFSKNQKPHSRFVSIFSFQISEHHERFIH